MIATVFAAVALLSWPDPDPAGRLHALSVAAVRRTRTRIGPVRLRYWLLLLAVVPVAVLAGLPGVLGFGLLAMAWVRQARRRDLDAAAVSSARSLAEALRVMVAELRAGAPPAVAAESAAADAPAAIAAAMREVASSARLGGELGVEPGPVLDQLARAWSLTQRHGLPMAEVLDAVRRDLVAAVRLTARTRAAMAGPRSSAVVLALLPALGLLLGEAMGAMPFRVLTGTAPGQVLLVLGCALVCAGMTWSARIAAGQVVLR
ncbi:type II secretion system F family protein [Amycolatopsis nigrescens]|uniref:type II secretion system F family protein n=1 Tax=Amycolatopsis nigrescens TaxID=381445 RepID=UPI00037FA029|nr:type II secretion system F family protein [Amycolatopsis nigrescens]